MTRNRVYETKKCSHHLLTAGTLTTGTICCYSGRDTLLCPAYREGAYLFRHFCSSRRLRSSMSPIHNTVSDPLPIHAPATFPPLERSSLSTWNVENHSVTPGSVIICIPITPSLFQIFVTCEPVTRAFATRLRTHG